MIPADSPMNLPGLPLLRVSFHLRTLGELELPSFSGGVLRGALGYALRDVACRHPQRNCDDCPLRRNCACAVLFETPRPADAELMRLYPRVPHPLALIPPPGGGYDAGAFLTLGAVLVGEGNRYLPELAEAVLRLGERGLGPRRVPLAADRIEREDGTCWLPEDPLPAPALYPLPPAGDGGPASTALRFVTPLRLVREGRELRQPGFGDLFRALLRRVSMIAAFHGPGRPELDYAALAASADGVESCWADSQWHDQQRFSTRQRRATPLNGLTGSLQLDGLQPRHWPWLRLGEALGVGKNTLFGLGRYVVLG